METINKQTGSKFGNWKVWAVGAVALISALVYWGTRPAIVNSGTRPTMANSGTRPAAVINSKEDQAIYSAALKVSKQIDKAMASGDRKDADLVITYAYEVQEIHEIANEDHLSWMYALQAVVRAAVANDKDALFAAQKGLQLLTESILRTNG